MAFSRIGGKHGATRLLLLLLAGTLGTGGAARAEVCALLAEATRWQYTDASPAPGWEAVAFEARSWAGGCTPFTYDPGGTCPLPQGTPWPADTTRWGRRAFTIQEERPSILTLYVAIDNDVDVYLNGSLVASIIEEDCAFRWEYVLALDPGLLRTGKNVLAARMTDRGGIAGFDARLEGDFPNGCPWTRPLDTCGPAYDLHRNAWDASWLPLHRAAVDSLVDDDSALLGDGVLYFYRVAEMGRPEARIAVTRNDTAATVRISWDDFGIGEPMIPEPDGVRVGVSSVCVEAGGLDATVVIVRGEDAAGVTLGSGLDVLLDEVAVFPGAFDGPPLDMRNGRYATTLRSPSLGSGEVRGRIEGVWGAETATVLFVTSRPRASFVGPSTVRVGSLYCPINTTGGGEAPLAFSWDFDGDGLDDSPEESPCFAYGTPGPYRVNLEVTDANACPSRAQAEVDVLP